MTITAPDGRVKTLVPSKQQQRRIIRIMSSVLALEFILCISMITFESIVLSVLSPPSLSDRPGHLVSSTDSYHYYVRTCRIGSGIWAGLIGLLCVGIGISLMLARANCLHVCTGRVGTLKVVYGSTAFLCAIVDAILVASVSMCIFGLVRAIRVAERRVNSGKKTGNDDVEAGNVLSMLKTALILDSSLIAAAGLHSKV